MPAPARVAVAQALISQRFPDALPVERWSRGMVPTGVDALDRILPSGGFQRGRLAVWTPGAGAAALLRAAALRAVAGGERAVWIDATRSVTGACWREGPLLVRPATELAALRAAEELGRSGGFALVVIDGVEPESPALVRCTRAAHEGGAALVLVTRATSLASLRLSSQMLPWVGVGVGRANTASASGRWGLQRSASVRGNDSRPPTGAAYCSAPAEPPPSGKLAYSEPDKLAYSEPSKLAYSEPGKLAYSEPSKLAYAEETTMIRTVRVRVTARASGWHATAELALPVWHDDLRLSLELRDPDRRGVRR